MRTSLVLLGITRPSALFRRGDRVSLGTEKAYWVRWVDDHLGAVEIVDRKPWRIWLWAMSLAEAIGQIGFVWRGYK